MFISKKEIETNISGTTTVVDKNETLWREMIVFSKCVEEQALNANNNEIAQQARQMGKQALQALNEQCLPFVVCRELPEQYVKFLEKAR